MVYFCRSGVNQWRDQQKPSQILQDVAKMRGLPPPIMEEDGRSMLFSGRRFHLQDFGAVFDNISKIILFFYVLYHSFVLFVNIYDIFNLFRGKLCDPLSLRPDERKAFLACAQKHGLSARACRDQNPEQLLPIKSIPGDNMFYFYFF